MIDISNWKIYPMKMVHNVDCIGFLIYNKIESKTIFYATDTRVLPKIDNKIDIAIVDCNYSEEIVYDLLYHNKEVGIGYKNHNSVENAMEWLKECKHKPSCFVAYHLSNSGLTSIEKIKQVLSPYSEIGGKVVISRPNTKICF